MSVPTSEEDLRSATWIVGERGKSAGVYVTASGILVKYGHHIRSQRERQTLDFVHEKCPQVPIPQVFGSWKGEDGIEYLAMSKMPGTMLSTAWAAMETGEKESVLRDLRAILDQFRGLRAPAGALIGSLDGGPAADCRARHTEFGGPFRTESEFNEWLVSLIHPESTQFHSSFYVETIRSCLKCNHQLRFTHGDLGFHNILVENGRITAIIDFEFAGWYPEYWEYLKMIQFSRDSLFRCFARLCWSDGAGNQVTYDENFAIDQMLDSQARHGDRVIKRPR
ncbi:hypothetical protein H109_04076 [Trichophyton interdigitale MR816]|uniref:Aminoglycoside phosphotransferase domain-containing protein n=1 Tax=Trichophyton interdigitale (strain MR816) TaxID=1215338 RepID=A0A059J8A9_TRIIM|nr:hypothetical protein H101_00172 [Trichophyton interdigitale H6]KDB24044.1 hypothetical protein H109_04076 [Trichophyton interdigitale MR816]